MSQAAFNFSAGGLIATDVDGIDAGWSQIATLKETPDAVNSDSVHAPIQLGATEQYIGSEIFNPDVPRNVVIKGNVAGIAGDVVVYGNDIADEYISETIQLAGVAVVAGNKAFKTVEDIVVPAQTHTPTAQVETIQVLTGCTQDGAIEVIVTSAQLVAPEIVEVDVTTNDNLAADVASQIRGALSRNSNINSKFVVGGSNDEVTLTSREILADDGTLAISTIDTPATGVTVVGSQNTTTGVLGKNQIETIVCTALCSQQGTIQVTVNSILLAAPEVVDVRVTTDDDSPAKVATKVRDALGLNTNIIAAFTVSGDGANIVLTTVDQLADDATLEFVTVDAPSTGVAAGAEVNTASGQLGFAQIETVTVTAACDKTATLVVRVTSALLDGGYKDVDVSADAGDDTVNKVATKVRAALVADADIGDGITGNFAVTGDNADVILTANIRTWDDGTLAITLEDADGSTVTFGASQDTQAGVLPINQIETRPITTASSGQGTLACVVIAANMPNTPKAVNVDVDATDDTIEKVAAKIRAAFILDTDIGTFFSIGGANGNIVMETVTDADNDGTMAINLTEAPLTLVTFSQSQNTQAGVLPVNQVETLPVFSGCSQDGTIVVVVTAANMSNSPKSVNVDVTTTDVGADAVATKIRAAFVQDTDINGFFSIGGSGVNVVLTARDAVANDATMAITVIDAPATGVTFGASQNTQAAVDFDTVSVGVGSKLGLPYRLSRNTVLQAFLNGVKEGVAPTVAIDSDDIADNTIQLVSALNGDEVVINLVVPG